MLVLQTNLLSMRSSAFMARRRSNSRDNKLSFRSRPKLMVRLSNQTLKSGTASTCSPTKLRKSSLSAA